MASVVTKRIGEHRARCFAIQGHLFKQMERVGVQLARSPDDGLIGRERVIDVA